MDLTSLMSTLLCDDTINGVGKKAGASSAEVRGVLANALPLLLNGANAQATNEATSTGFSSALQQHAQTDTSSLSSFFGGVDMLDGAKIVAHLLGANSQSQTQALSQQSGVSEAATGNILSATAPLLMSLLGQQTATEANSGLNVGSLMGSLLGSGDISGLLSGLLGGTTAAAQPEPEVVPISENNTKPTGLLAKLLSLLK